jgi:predicted permease
MFGFARLKPGVTLERARAEMAVLHQQATTEKDSTMRVVPLKEQMVAGFDRMLWMLLGAVGFVLLIACASVASLLLARAAARSHELAVRAALGAARAQLIGQLLAESVVLAVVGGALGVLLARWGLDAILSMNALRRPAMNALYLPGGGDIRLDATVLAFTLAVSVATGLLFGLFPALRVSRPDLAGVLRERSSAGGRGVAGAGMRGLLVRAQIALSVVLLVGAALLVKSIARLHGVDPGFRTANLLTMKVSLPATRYDTPEKKTAFFADVVRRVETLPAVGAVTVAMSLPTTNNYLGTNVYVEGQPPESSTTEPLIAQLQSIAPVYFRTLGIPLRRGREFNAADNIPGARPVFIINESFARRFWPEYPRGLDPVGRHMGEGADRLRAAEIVGIVADVRERGLAADAPLEFYLPTVLHPPQSAFLAVRTTGDPLRLADAVRRQVLMADGGQAVSDIRTMDAILDAKLGQQKLTMLLLGLFAGVALLLAMVGIYGVTAYSVTQRKQEVGIRRALGAQQGDILMLVLRQGLMLAVSGVAVGLAGAFALTRVMKEFLFQVSATDPAAFAGIALLFILVAGAASFIPARRAARVDPMAALRVG